MNLTSLPCLPDNDILSYKVVYQQLNPSPMNFTSGTNTQDFVIFGMPSNYAICAVKINPQIGFVGASITGLTCSVGVTGTPAFYAPAFDVTQTVTFQTTTPLSQYSLVAHDVVAHFISTGAFINAITAGQVELTVQIRPLP